MEKNMNGSSLDLIIHPGESLAEALEIRNMNQSDLAIKTGISKKYISEVISGQKRISPRFAKKLESALGVSRKFWLNLQENYDEEIINLLR